MTYFPFCSGTRLETLDRNTALNLDHRASFVTVAWCVLTCLALHSAAES